MEGYARGGIVNGPTRLIRTLEDDECVLTKHGECVREDAAHLRAGPFEVMGDGRTISVFYGECMHPACHVVMVESTVDGSPLARLCKACDLQMEV